MALSLSLRSPRTNSDNPTRPGRALEAFARALFQRALLSSHTLAPDKQDLDGWMENLFARVPPLYIDIDLYVRVLEQPDPAKMEAYGVTTDFYRADDPVVRLARDVQHGRVMTDAARCAAAAAEGANHGGYGRALALALRRLQDASAYLTGACDTPPHVTQ